VSIKLCLSLDTSAWRWRAPQDKRTPRYDKQVVSDEYLKSDATYESPALYYYSCECGERGIETFEYGECLVNENAPKIVISSIRAVVGSSIKVTISLINNPGLASMKLSVAFDGTVLTLENITYNSDMGGMSQQPQTMNSPVTLNWFNGSENFEGDAVYATLTFNISNTAEADSILSISVTYDSEDVYNIDYTDINFAVENGSITVLGYTPGDINGDGVVNNKDLSILFQYLSGWEVTVNEAALDVNGDGKTNNKDLSILFQYLSDWDVEIY